MVSVTESNFPVHWVVSGAVMPSRSRGGPPTLQVSGTHSSPRTHPWQFILGCVSCVLTLTLGFIFWQLSPLSLFRSLLFSVFPFQELHLIDLLPSAPSLWKVWCVKWWTLQIVGWFFSSSWAVGHREENDTLGYIKGAGYNIKNTSRESAVFKAVPFSLLYWVWRFLLVSKFVFMKYSTCDVQYFSLCQTREWNEFLGSVFSLNLCLVHCLSEARMSSSWTRNP